MKYKISSCEIAELAIVAEQAGVEFYAKLSEAVKDPKQKEVFQFLSEQEVEHIKVFRDMAKETKEHDEHFEYAIDIKEHMTLFMNRLKSASFDFSDTIGGLQSLAKCIDLGIEVEKNFIEMYRAMSEQPTKKFHAILVDILKQEQEHLETLVLINSKMGVFEELIDLEDV